MKKSIKNQILSRIYGRGRGWCFTPNDFAADFNRNDINVALYALTNENKIRRISIGLYDYPIYSDILEKYVAPDIEQSALAIARKFSWRIQPSGETALHYLGLSTQITSKHIYFSDGPNKKYNLLGQTLEFKHQILKEASILDANSILIIQAIKAIGENNITDEIKTRLKSKFSNSEWMKIKKNSSKATGWIYQIISNIVNELSINND